MRVGRPRALGQRQAVAHWKTHTQGVTASLQGDHGVAKSLGTGIMENLKEIKGFLHVLSCHFPDN